MTALVKGLQGFQNTVMAARARAQGHVTARYQRLVREMLKDLAKNTPQWSGDLAASWQVMVGANNQVAVDLGYTYLKGESDFVNPKWIGDKDAVEHALQANRDAIAKIRWNSHVSIQNASQTLTDGDRGDNPLNEDNLRPGNFIPGDIMATALVAAKYSRTKMRLENES